MSLKGISCQFSHLGPSGSRQGLVKLPLCKNLPRVGDYGLTFHACVFHGAGEHVFAQLETSSSHSITSSRIQMLRPARSSMVVVEAEYKGEGRSIVRNSTRADYLDPIAGVHSN